MQMIFMVEKVIKFWQIFSSTTIRIVSSDTNYLKYCLILEASQGGFVNLMKMGISNQLQKPKQLSNLITAFFLKLQMAREFHLMGQVYVP